MAQLTANFEAGTNGSNITTGAGEASANAWDVVTIGALQGFSYDNTHAQGNLAAKVVASGSGAVSYGAWTTSLGTITDHYGRAYLYLTANPGDSARFLVLRSGGTGGTISAALRVHSTGVIRCLGSANAFIQDTTNTISLNQWIRVEWHIIHSATVGQIEVKLFNTADSTTPTETLTSAANKNTGANADTFQIGNPDGIGIAVTYWMDNVVGNATSYPGPATTAAVTTTFNPALAVVPAYYT